MIRRLLTLLAFVLVLAVPVAASADPSRDAAAQHRDGSGVPEEIEHIVVVVLENSTFDHLFGTYPGVDGLDPARDRQRASDGRILGPQRLSAADLGRRGTFPTEVGDEALSNSANAARAAYADGAMDGFLTAQAERGGHEELVLRYFDRSHYPYLWRLADEGVLFDRYFSSFMGDSLPNVLHLVAGDHAGIRFGSRNTLRELWDAELPTIFDEAEAAGVTWGYYIGGLDRLDHHKLRTGGYFEEDSAGTPSQLYWAPVLSMRRFWEDPSLRQGIHDQDEFFEHAARGDLPQISYILPSPNTHWPTMPEQSEHRIVSLVDAITKSPSWDHTAMLFVWDDYGGFYDHVLPPQVHEDGLGFRVPALLVSPLAQRGVVSSIPHDHTSVPAFIADTFDLPHAGNRYTAGLFDGVWADDGPAARTLLSAERTEPYEAFGREHAGSVYRAYTRLLALTAALAFVLVLAAHGTPGAISIATADSRTRRDHAEALAPLGHERGRRRTPRPPFTHRQPGRVARARIEGHD
jgi:phospholipase C